MAINLREHLEEAYLALHKLRIGQQVVSIQYGGSGSSRSLTYSSTDINKLKMYIEELEEKLGIKTSRRRGPAGFRL